ncbi:GMC oxidoreductase [Brevibacillus borstelensis]|uniref:GMC oxidoreductase n=1 Tax=Brevibacillus borstelensis TaxID=45462 RepID=UPI0030C32B3E
MTELPPFPIPFQSIKHMKENEYDILIVGTGAGGAAVLWRLCAAWQDSKKRIAIIDAGDLLLHTHVYNIPELKERWDHCYAQNVHPIGKQLPQFSGAEQVFALGGRTIFWGAAIPRIHASEWVEWPFPSQELDAYYEIAEGLMHNRETSSASSSPLLEQLYENGFHQACTIPSAVSNGQTFSSLCFLRKAWEKHPFDLSVKTRALQLVMENGKPVGLTVRDHQKNRHVVRAKTIVLAAGPLETPRLLLHSGIYGNTIGHYLTSHSYIRATGIHMEENTSEQLSAFLPQTDKKSYQFQIYKGNGSVLVVGFGKVESSFDNKLSLNKQSVDEYGVPNIHIDFSYSRNDTELIRQMNMEVPKIFDALGANINHIQIQPPGSDYHENGTCRMGNNPLQSATNTFGQIHGIPGLYAADNSILPSIGAANPTLTTVALAIRIADRLANQ